MQQPYPDESLRAMQIDLTIRQAGVQPQPLPLCEALDLYGIQLQLGHAGHQTFQRQYASITFPVAHCRQLRQAVAVFQIEMGNRSAAQADQVRTAAQRRADIFGECADVCAFAAAHGDVHLVAGKLIQQQLVYHDATQFAFYSFAFADIFVKRLALVLERAVHRRELLDLAAKSCQHGINV